MNMKKRLLSLLLAITLLTSASVTVMAASYSDLKGHWAESYITELSDLGYLTGYTDGTVKPNKTITACEAIALLSRFYSVEEDVTQWIHEDYGDFVETYIDPNLSWAYDEIEMCLAAGILSEKELRSLRLTAPIEKELLSVLLVRALQLTDEAAELVEEGVELTFSDTDEIAASYRGHIAVLVNNGIIEGNDKNQFTPHAEVTRGVVAAMVVRGLEYVEQQGGDLALSGYENFSKRTGVLTGYSSSVLTLRDTDGVSRSYTIPATASVTVGGEAKALSDAYVGCYVTIRVEDASVTTVTVRNEEGISWTQGKLTEVGKTSNGYNLYLTDLDTGKSARHLAPTDATVTINGEKKALSDLKAGMFLTATLKNDRISDVAAVSGSNSLTGTIQTLTFGAPVVLEVSSEDGGSIRFLLDLADLPTIMRGDNQVSIERLSVGDEVTLTIDQCELSKISAKASEDTLDGILTSIISTAAGTTWMITDAENQTHSLVIDPAANAYQGSKAILIGIIQVGDTISVVSDGKTITEVYLKSAGGDTANKLSGTVLVVDAKAKQITVLSSTNKLVYISTRSVGSIVNASTGKTLTLSNVDVNSQLLAYGEYTDASNFSATSIIIE